MAKPQELGVSLKTSVVRPDRASFAVEAALVVALAYVAASFIWMLIAPSSFAPMERGGGRAAAPAVAQAAAYRPEAGGFNLFRAADQRAGASDVDESDAPVSSLNLAVSGARVSSAPGGAGGTAIIRTPDGQQRVYAVGDEIIEGVVLYRVEHARVLLRRQGVVEALPFATRELQLLGRGGAAAPQNASVQQQESRPAAISAAALFQSVSARPASDQDGAAVYPLGDGAAFAALGFEPGDIIERIDGRAVADADALRAAIAAVAVGSTIEVIVRRGEAARTITFEIE